MINFIFRNVGSASALQRPFKLDSLAAGAIAGVGSLVGGLFSSSGSRYAARKQLQAVRETNAANLQIAQQNNAFNERMWNKQNKYNTPSAQRARLEAAGINPYLMLDGSSTGVAESAPSADSSGSQVAPDVGSTIAGGYQSLGNSIASAASQIAQMSFNDDLQKANVAKSNAEAQNVDLQNQYDALRNQFAASQFLADLRLKQYQGMISKYDAQYLRDSLDDRLDSVKFQNTLLGSQVSYYNQLAGLTDVQRKIEETNLQWLPREKQVSIMVAIQNARTAASQMRLNNASARNMIAMAALNAANEAGVRLDNKLKDTVFDLSVGLVENQYQHGYALQDQARRGLNLSIPQMGAAVVSVGSKPTPPAPRKAKKYNR